MDAEKLLAELKRGGSPRNVKGMKKFAITGSPAYGCSVPAVRAIAGRLKREAMDDAERNALAAKLWASGVHEAKLLASMIATPGIGWRQAEKWIGSCRNWAEVDQLCSNLLWELDGVEGKALQYAEARELWKKRTGFVLMAVLAVRRREKLDGLLADEFFAAIERERYDERNFVKKAVNWALRQIGKGTNRRNWRKAMALAGKLAASGNATARWIGTDARRELIAMGPRKY